MSDCYETIETIKVGGLSFAVAVARDDDATPPWDREDGHGPVSDWRRSRDKSPGERVVSEDRGSYRFYDMREAVCIAERDAWGLCDEARAKLSAKLGREPTKGEIRAQAVENDFQRLRAWCDDEWSYVVLRVTLLDVEGEDTDTTAYCGGFESDYRDYILESAHVMAQELARDIGRKKYIDEGARRIRVRA